VSAQLLNYQTARIRVSNSDTKDIPYEVPSQFSGSDLYKDYVNGLFFNHLGFDFTPKGRFGMSLYDRNNRAREYVSTVGEPFVVMKYYMEIVFKLESRRIFGLGERTTSFNLHEGTYTLFNQNNGDTIDDGQPGASPK